MFEDISNRAKPTITTEELPIEETSPEEIEEGNIFKIYFTHLVKLGILGKTLCTNLIYLLVF